MPIWRADSRTLRGTPRPSRAAQQTFRPSILRHRPRRITTSSLRPVQRKLTPAWQRCLTAGGGLLARLPIEFVAEGGGILGGKAVLLFRPPPALLRTAT